MDVNQLVSSSDNRVANDATIPGKYLLSGTSVKTVWAGRPSAKGCRLGSDPRTRRCEGGRWATGTTVNDVMISAVAIGLTRYLNENGDHKTDELIWMVPVSIQPVEPGVPKELGNHFALVVLRMPIGITDFRECLANMRADGKDQEQRRSARHTAWHRQCAKSAGRWTYQLLREQGGRRADECSRATSADDAHAARKSTVFLVGLLARGSANDDLHLQLQREGHRRVSGADKALVPDLNRLSELFYQGFQDMYAEIVEGASPIAAPSARSFTQHGG